MLRFFKKKVLIPSGQVEEIEAVRSWTVQWHAQRKGVYGIDTKKPQYEVFINKEDALLFATSVKDAFKLLRFNGVSNTIQVYENKNV